MGAPQDRRLAGLLSSSSDQVHGVTQLHVGGRVLFGTSGGMKRDEHSVELVQDYAVKRRA
jgi:hypothetical protein